MITVYDIIIIIVIVLIITPLILAIIITSRRPKFGRFDNVSSRRKFGNGPEDDAEISELDQIALNIDENLDAEIIEPQILTNALKYIGKSRHLIPKLKKELDEYRKHGVMPYSEHEVIPISEHEVIPISDHYSQIADNNARHKEYKETYEKTFQAHLDASHDKIEELTSELERLRKVLSTNNAELERLRSLNAEKNQQSVNMQPSGNTKEIITYKRELAELRENRKKTSEINELLLRENNQLQESNDDLQTRLATLEKTNKSIYMQIEQFTHQIGEITFQNNKLQQIINAKDRELAGLNKQINEINKHEPNNRDESYNYGLSLGNEIGDKLENNFLAENSVEDEFSSAKITELNATIQAQSAQLAKLQTELDLLRSENDALKKSILTLQARLTAESAKVANLEQQNADLKEHIEQCRNTKDQVGSDSNGRLYELIKENTELVNKLESLINDTPPQTNDTSSQ